MEKICVDPNASKQKCIYCGGTVYTCEAEVEDVLDDLCPAHPEGTEMDQGWVCSSKCWNIMADKPDKFS